MRQPPSKLWSTTNRHNQSMKITPGHRRIPIGQLDDFVEEMKELAQDRPDWEVVDSLKLDFDTDHPQGLVKIEDHYYLSTVKKKGWFREGSGHLIKFDEQGTMLDKIKLGDDKRYHPGGIDYDGESIWVSVAEYKEDSSTTIYRVDPESMNAEQVFEVPDHIGAISRDPDSGHLHGATWGSKRMLEWSEEGEPLSSQDNPNSSIAYQDWKFAGDGMFLSSGLGKRKWLIGPRNTGIELIDSDGQLLAEVPVDLKSPKGKPMTQNPMTFRYDDDGLRLFVVPDDDHSQMFVLKPAEGEK